MKLMDSSELNTLTQTTSPTLNLGSTVSGLITFVTIASLVITVVIMVMWVLSWMHRRKVQNAILDIQSVLHEMNERAKTTQPQTIPPENDQPN